MLRVSALACLAGFLSIPAMADNAKFGPITMSAGPQSGTTTYFGSAPAAPVAEAAKPEPVREPTLTASVNLAKQIMVVYVNGEPRYSWPISSGVAAHATPTGNFRPQWTAKMWYSRKYDMAPMPNAVFINGGVAVHGTYHTGALGSPASHGCIRLSTANARTFYNLVQRHGLGLTRVSVFGRPNWRNQAVASNAKQRKDVYADNQDNGWFFNSWGGDSNSAYAPNFTKKKYRRANGDYAQQPRRIKYKTYGSN